MFKYALVASAAALRLKAKEEGCGIEEAWEDILEMLDRDGNGEVSYKEVKQAIKKEIKQQIRPLFKEMDADGSGDITFEECVPYFGEEDCMAAGDWDRDGSDSLDINEIATGIYKEFEDEVRAFFDMVDADGNGSVTFDEFKQFVMDMQGGPAAMIQSKVRKAAGHWVA